MGPQLVYEAEQKQENMDVPKITVFKSPPWHKPAPQKIVPKISDVYEEYPSKLNVIPRHKIMSRSLESIPENTVLNGTNKYSTNHLRDRSRLSPHQVLPPINGKLMDDWPEMRQRAYSDPHKYTVRRKTEEKKESPLAKSPPHKVNNSVVVKQPSPPSHDYKQCDVRIGVNSDHKVSRRTTSKENLANKGSPITKKKTTDRSTMDSSSSSVGAMKSTEQNRQSSLRKVSNNVLAHKPPANPSKSRSERRHGDHERPTTLNYNLADPKSCTSKCVSFNNILPHRYDTSHQKNRHLHSPVKTSLIPNGVAEHPTLRALRNCESPSGMRSRTSSLPGTPSEKWRNKKHESATENRECSKTRVAYALVGSPGRDRWPSPEREATSYITEQECANEQSSADRGQDTPDSESHVTIASSPQEPSQEPTHEPSQEFKSILEDLGFSQNNYSFML